MEFFRQDYWSELPFPTSGDFPDRGIKPASPMSPTLTVGFFTAAPPGKPLLFLEILEWDNLSVFLMLNFIEVPGELRFMESQSHTTARTPERNGNAVFCYFS